MPERRAFKRYPVELFDITTSSIQTGNIEIININLNSIALNAIRRLNIGEKYALKIQSEGKALSLYAIVIWSKISRSHKFLNGDTIPIYSAGLEFIDVSKYLGDQINIFIEKYKRDDTIDDDTGDDVLVCNSKKSLRHYPRFQVHPPEKAFIIDQSQCFPLKDLSYGGLRIEYKNPMKVNSTVPMLLNFPDERFIVFQGRVVSCLLIQKAYPKAYTIRIAFNEISVKDRKLLSEYICFLDDIDKSPSE